MKCICTVSTFIGSSYNQPRTNPSVPNGGVPNGGVGAGANFGIAAGANVLDPNLMAQPLLSPGKQNCMKQMQIECNWVYSPVCNIQ